MQYGPDWSNDFFEVGALEEVDGLCDAYWVDDVDYCIEQADDMVAGEGDFAVDGPQPCQCVDVTVLDRDELVDFLMGKGFDMWCFTVTPDDFTVFELTPEYVQVRGPYPAGTFKEALDGVLDVVRHAFPGFDVYAGFAHSSFDPKTGFLNGIVKVRLPFEGVFDDGE